MLGDEAKKEARRLALLTGFAATPALRTGTARSLDPHMPPALLGSPLRLGHATRFRILSEMLIELSRLHTFNQSIEKVATSCSLLGTTIAVLPFSNSIAFAP